MLHIGQLNQLKVLEVGAYAAILRWRINLGVFHFRCNSVLKASPPTMIGGVYLRRCRR